MNGCKPWIILIEKIELKPDLEIGTIGEESAVPVPANRRGIP